MNKGRRHAREMELYWSIWPLMRVERVNGLDEPPKFSWDGLYGQKQIVALQTSIPAGFVASYSPSGTVIALLNLRRSMSLSV